MMTPSLLRNLALGTLLLGAAAGTASAQTIVVNCTQNPQAGYLAAQLASAAANTVVQITGMCLGNVTVTADGLAFESGAGLQNAMQSGTSLGSDGITGQLEIAGARNVLVNGLTLQGGASDLPGVVFANLWLHGGASAIVQATAIAGAQRDGILVNDGASLAFQSGLVENIGIAGVAGASSDVQVEEGSTATLGFANSDGTPVGAGSFTPWVSLAAGSGTGITLRRGGSLAAYRIDIESAASIAVGERAQLHLEDVAAKTIQLVGGASAWLQNSTITGGLGVVAGSSAVLLGSGVSGALASGATLQASNGSSITLAGGNTVQGSVQIDHAASLMQQSGAVYGFAAAADSIAGNGLVQVQGTAELGIGPIGGQPSLTWQGSLTVQQNSALRASGGMSVTGAILLEQASNAFFNLGNGGVNAVGGGVSCVFSNVLASHVSGGGGVSPPVPTITNATGAASPQCLSF